MKNLARQIAIDDLHSTFEDNRHQRSRSQTSTPEVPVQVRTFSATVHAKRRSAQRGVALHDIDYILGYGKTIFNGHAEFYYLRTADIPEYDRKRMERLSGTALVVLPNSFRVITVWRNRKSGHHHIQCKKKTLYLPIIDSEPVAG